MAECIERETAIAIIEEKQKELCPVGMYSRHAVYGSDREKFDAWEEIIEAFEAIPAADVQPVRHGRWARLDKRRGSYLFYCSECGGRAYYVHGVRKSEPVCGYRYCPNCGAKMDGGET